MDQSEYNQFKIHTLISMSNQRCRDKNNKDYYRYQNYNTFVQACSLRSQLFNPQVQQQTMTVDNVFAGHHSGEHHVWTFSFETEHNVTQEQLQHDLDGIPVHDSVGETHAQHSIEFDNNTVFVNE